MRLPLGDEHADEGGGHYARLARPGQESELLAAPGAAPVREQARQDGRRTCTKISAASVTRAGTAYSSIVSNGRFAEGEEHEDDDDVRRGLREDAHLGLAMRMHPEPEVVHVRDDQPGNERAEVAPPA